ncbi:heterokaryon incompatibility protein [Fusarium bulbicola]|nr:heterokaryon incompatibility protein [Fusarium bulbicola]
MAQPQNHTTCDDCINILQDAASLLQSESAEASSASLFHIEHHLRLATNVSSSKCHMCTLLYAQIPRLWESFSSEEVLALTISKGRHEPHGATVGLIGFERDAVDSQTHYPGSLRTQNATHGRVRFLNSPKTWSLETLNSIRSWLKSCTSSHNGCTKSKAASRLPLRLVDVMSTGSDQFPPMAEIGPERFDLLSLENFHNVRIVPTTHSLPPKTPYLTLSHRWGTPPSILLTKKTSFLLTEDISHHLLNCNEAAVFRHAVHVTRALGFRYIWIDALCIMQDQESEKMTEVMHMDEIYVNSMLNISATEGRVHEGLVFDRKALYINPCRATVRISETQENVRLQAFPDKWRLRPTEGSLNKRGWVFQERTLAPRIVHFTKDQIARLSPNFFDGTDSCRLRLRGPICKFRRNVQDGAPWIRFGQHTSFQEFHEFEFEFQGGRAIIIYWDTSRKVVANEFFLLRIASEQSEDGTVERGVVLRRTVERGTYIRVGTFLTPSKSDYPGSELDHAFDGRLDTLSTDEYLALELGGEHTIDIIWHY